MTDRRDRSTATTGPAGCTPDGRTARSRGAVRRSSCRQVARDIDLLVETFRDYNETTIHRTRTLRVRAEGDAYWTETGFDES